MLARLRVIQLSLPDCLYKPDTLLNKGSSVIGKPVVQFSQTPLLSAFRHL